MKRALLTALVALTLVCHIPYHPPKPRGTAPPPICRLVDKPCIAPLPKGR